MASRSYEVDNDPTMSLENNHQGQDYRGMNNGTDLSEASDQGTQSRYLSHLDRGRAANFFINGDSFFPSKKLVYNPKHFKDFSHYLDYLTDKLEPRFGAVRKICTPHHGHRIRELRDLQENGIYVVAGKERFKPYQYDQIMPYEMKRSMPSNYNLDPVAQNRQNLTSGRIKKCETHSLLIKVWPNGGDLKGPRRVLLTPRVRPFTLRNVVAQVNEILKNDCLGTVEKLYFLNGVHISDVDQITHNGQYVACRKIEKFKRVRYSEQSTKNLSTSPRLERKLLPPIYPRYVNSTNQSTPDHSNPSTQNSVASSSKRYRTSRNDEKMFPARPVKHTRSSEWASEDGFNKDQGGLFRAKQGNRNIYGTKPIEDNNETRTDVTEDQVKNHPRQSEPNQRFRMKTDDQQARHVSNRMKDTPIQRHEQSDHSRQNHHDDKTHKGVNKLEAEDSAATKIQSAFRGHKTRRELYTEKLPRTAPQKQNHYVYDDKLEEFDNAATKIQSAYRGHKSRNKLTRSEPPRAPSKDKHISSPRILNEDEGAAVKIQSAYRGYQTRRQLHDRTNQNKQNLSDKSGDQQPEPKVLNNEEAASKIQAAFRGYQTRQQMNSQEHKKEEDQATSKIQAGFRGYQTRKHIDTTNKAATKIQAGYRGYQTRKHVDTTNKAATKIQAGYRGYQARKNTTSCHNPPTDSSREEEDKAAAKIQAGYRGYMSRKKFNAAQPTTPREDSYHELDKENNAAVTIQSHYRGYRARKEFTSQQEAED